MLNNIVLSFSNNVTAVNDDCCNFLLSVKGELKPLRPLIEVCNNKTDIVLVLILI